MNLLYTHLAALAAEDAGRPALIDCDERGSVVREISRIELLRTVEQNMAKMADRTEPLLLEGASNANFLMTCWAAWCAGVTVVPLDGRRDTEETRAYKREAAGKAEGEALILFTSGTTARPKGARLTLENLLTNARDIAAWLRITPEDRFLVQLPLHHINSTTFCLATLLAGGSIALPPRYSNSHFWEVVSRTEATLTSIVQTIMFDQLSRIAEFNAVKETVRLSRIQIGSAPVVASSAAEFMRRFSIPLYQGYGQTETALRVTGVPMGLPPKIYEKAVAENSIGAPLPWAEVQVADESGNILKEGEEGELTVRGPAVMKGYVAGEPAFRDGWFLTGDIGLWRMAGTWRFFYLKGRKKEIIIKGGVNISPVAVEDALLRVSDDIDQAYVVGVVDERYGEEVGAVFVWKSGENPAAAMRRLQLNLFRGTPHLAGYETPKYLTAMKPEELPATSTGKIQRMELKRTASAVFEPLERLFETRSYRFDLLAPQSPLFEASLALYNHCWQPLAMDAREYKKYLADCFTLAAVNKGGGLDGQISFSVKDGVLTCLSICSAAFKPKPVPDAKTIPSPEEVRDYLLGGHDPVMNFHQNLGAALIEVIPGGRPDDKSSLGYTMLLRYPPSENIAITEQVPVSNQLIEAARIVGRDLDAEVYALSRPGGLAAYLSRA